MSDVTIQSSWDNDNVGINLLLKEVLSKSGTIGQGVGSTNKDEAINLMLFDRFGQILEI